ncbi:hypothetical protein AAG570_012036 [Ranatra chinensis]|uniref:Uncharacterized protein n=1 Tax=Ranatra chinensis TaxID=642074 RepID=A0ABD0YHU3_9HEMI
MFPCNSAKADHAPIHITKAIDGQGRIKRCRLNEVEIVLRTKKMPHKRSDFINYKVRLCSDADLQAVDGLLRRSLYLGEPLARGLDPADIPGREEGHASALIPQGMSLMAETLGEVPRVIGACLNDRPPQSDTYIYTKTIEDKKCIRGVL